MIGALPLMAAVGLCLLFSGLLQTEKPRPRMVSGWDRLCKEANLKGWTGTRLLVASLLFALAWFIVWLGVTGSVALATALALPSSVAPSAYARSRRAARRKRYREAWPDAISGLISSVRAGVALPEAVVGLGDRGPTDLAPAFRSFGSTYRATGSFKTSLHRLRAEVADATVDRIAVALELAHDVGGTDLVRMLRALGDFVRDDLRTRREIESRWSWTTTAARVAAAAPWIVLGLMAMRPEASAAYSSPQGLGVIAIGTAATVLGYRAMLMAASLPEERRIIGRNSEDSSGFVS